jgi:hypothetical protein
MSAENAPVVGAWVGDAKTAGPACACFGAASSAARAAPSFQSAKKSCDFPSPVRPLVQQSFFPSGENAGRPSKPDVKVTRTGSCSPATSTTNNSKFSKPSLFEVKMKYLPLG